MFFLFFMLVWGGGHAYLTHRLIRPLRPSCWHINRAVFLPVKQPGMICN
jgi:hypothetical protein